MSAPTELPKLAPLCAWIARLQTIASLMGSWSELVRLPHSNHTLLLSFESAIGVQVTELLRRGAP